MLEPYRLPYHYGASSRPTSMLDKACHSPHYYSSPLSTLLTLHFITHQHRIAQSYPNTWFSLMPVCGPYAPYLSPTPLLFFLLILLRSTSDVNSPKGFFLSTRSYHPKARLRLQFSNPIINLVCFHHNFILLSIYLLIHLSWFKGENRVLVFFSSLYAQSLVLHLSQNRHPTELAWTILNLLSGLIRKLKLLA